jgi:hypothetical protein
MFHSRDDHGKEAISFPEETFPVNFFMAVESIRSLSQIIAEGPTGLLTGPQTIVCTSPVESSCSAVVMSNIDTISTHADAQGKLHLIGEHRVYNPFIVAMADWFYDADKYADATPPVIEVEADGFVFVHVVDHVQITALEGDKNYAIVTRAWDDEGDFQCKLGKNKKKPDSKKLPVIGNYINKSSKKSSKSSKSSRLLNSSSSKADLKHGLKNVIVRGAEDPSTHLLVNLWTSAQVNLDATGHSIIEEEALWCSGLQYEFSGGDEDFGMIEGTYVMTNPVSTIDLSYHNWEGGQLVTLGSKVEFHSVNMKQGLYLPDDSSFCSQPLARIGAEAEAA